MNSRCLVHIGYHKTATTWLQRELFSRSNKSFYPLSETDDPKPLGRFFIYDKEGYLLSPFQSRRDEFVEELDRIQTLHENETRIGVISNERLSGNPHSGGFDARLIADRIHESLPNATILCVVRRQQDKILSMYMQYLKAGGTDSLRNYLYRTYDGKRPGFSPGHLDYIHLVNHYTELFGEDQVLVLPYELFRESATEFIRILGETLSIDAEIPAQTAGKFHNKHLSDFPRLFMPGLNALAIRSSLNGYSPLRIPGFVRLLGLIRRGSAWFAGGMTQRRRNRMKTLIDSFVGDRYAAGNRLLGDRMKMDLSRYGYHD